MADAKGTAVAERRQAEIELAWRILEGSADIPEQDAEAAAAAIRARIRDADDFDSVFGEQELTAWEDLQGQIVWVHSFHLNKSTFEAGSRAYAVVVISDTEDGEKRLVTTGGQNVLAQLVKALERDWFPLQLMLIAKDTSTPGRRTYWLRKPA